VVDQRLFGPARQAAGVARADVPGGSVADVLAEAARRYGSGFAEVVAGSSVWLNGESASPDAVVTDQDELAVVPPVSGG
jgi:molybdopterin converting factor small subunit